MTQFNAGDRVRIGQLTTVQGAYDNFKNSITPTMLERVGSERTVKYHDEFGVRFTDDPYGYPAQALTLITPVTPQMGAIKDTNPKDAVGIRKAPMSTVSALVLQELGVAMLEGACKYGRHNYRVAGVRASVYFDAANRHLDAWYEGQDVDPDSGLNHITKAIASLVVLRDAMIQDKLVDDRPPSLSTDKLTEFQANLQKAVNTILDRYPTPKEAFTR